MLWESINYDGDDDDNDNTDNISVVLDHKLGWLAGHALLICPHPI